MRQIALPAAAALALALLPALPATAEPMWDVADRWTCTLELHIKAGTDGSNVRVNEEAGSVTYDFAEGTRTSMFVDTVADIGFKTYYESAYGGFNVIELLWDGESYPVMVVEDDGEFWETAASGQPRGEVWIASYKCEPDDGNPFN